MKEILIISGKGGTGKTSVTSSIAALCENKIMADADVDAADLYLVLQPSIIETHEFYGSKKAIIDSEKCTHCRLCIQTCRFDAINNFQVDPVLCEGCGVCYHICPRNAVSMKDNLSGHWYISDTPYGTLVHAKLGTAEENSGKLVAEVLRSAKEMAEQQEAPYIIIDGPPGIGCPVISALSDADMVLIVTEPTASSLHDLQRLLELIANFKVDVSVCINKYDLSEEQSRNIEYFCYDQGIPVIGKIPFDKNVINAIAHGIPPVKYGGPAALAIKDIWEIMKNKIDSE
ncbi:ATP-binding protein [Mahella sp.]|uniref:ATP-binding protein n=1 Tax=Mahella sp. TaxID=2798721 RepID=UPI0025BD4535|nr:ATP-binding protein [Mahella sp.]MBZ4666609.1 Cobyrinic acid ac-diamide synthase [Mahella sp.]MDK2903438.1 hypothetical protein [Clostridiales bacterium]